LFWQDAVLEEGVDKMKEFFDLTRVEETELTEVARCLKVGQLCRDLDRRSRLTMAEVLDMLNGEKEVAARKNNPH
jgi:L1 cell adhesion molecule like protein